MFWIKIEYREQAAQRKTKHSECSKKNVSISYLEMYVYFNIKICIYVSP